MIFYECWKRVLSLANLSGQLMFKLHIWFGKQFLDCGGLYAAVKATCFSYSLVLGTYWLLTRHTASYFVSRFPIDIFYQKLRLLSPHMSHGSFLLIKNTHIRSIWIQCEIPWRIFTFTWFRYMEQTTIVGWENVTFCFSIRNGKTNSLKICSIMYKCDVLNNIPIEYPHPSYS